MKERIDKLDFIKIKNFCSARDTVKRMKRQAIEKTYLQKPCLIKDCCPKIYKELLKLNNKKTHNLIKKWAYF